jgi:hypothetical protein
MSGPLDSAAPDYTPKELDRGDALTAEFRDWAKRSRAARAAGDPASRAALDAEHASLLGRARAFQREHVGEGARLGPRDRVHDKPTLPAKLPPGKQAMADAYAREMGSWEERDKALAREPNPNPGAVRTHRAEHARLMVWKAHLEDLQGIGNLSDPEPFDRVCAVRHLSLQTLEQVNLLRGAEDEGHTDPEGRRAREAWRDLLRPLAKLVQAVKRLEQSAPPAPIIPSKAEAATVEQYALAALDWSNAFHQPARGPARSRRVRSRLSVKGKTVFLDGTAVPLGPHPRTNR